MFRCFIPDRKQPFFFFFSSSCDWVDSFLDFLDVSTQTQLGYPQHRCCPAGCGSGLDWTWSCCVAARLVGDVSFESEMRVQEEWCDVKQCKHLPKRRFVSKLCWPNDAWVFAVERCIALVSWIVKLERECLVLERLYLDALPQLSCSSGLAQ